VISLCSWREGRSQRRRKRRKKTNRQRERDVPSTMAAIRRCVDAIVGGVDGIQEEQGPRDGIHCARDGCHFCSEKARRKHCN
jgi:hypothetical protein